MKTFNRANLPKEIKYNGRHFYCLGPMPQAMKEHQPGGRHIFCIVSVLSTNLKGREDLHGKPYKPNNFLFGALKPAAQEPKATFLQFSKY